MKDFDNIRLVLVETSHPGNIGAAARAMKTMGLKRLYLVCPKHFPDARASARAAGAEDVLAKTLVCDSLAEAVTDCILVMGTSARLRSLKWPQLSPRECAAQTLAEASRGEIALVFGRERVGLANTELELCHNLVHIPCNPDYGSLNLAAAVQVICYEMRMAIQDQTSPVEAMELGEAPAAVGEMERFYAHLEETLLALDFLDPANPRHLMRRLRRLFNRVRPTQNEVNILRGVLSAARVSKNGKKPDSR